MKIPRVTEVLKPFNNYSGVPTTILKNASTRGKAVHDLCGGIAKGSWIPDSMIKEDLLGYVNSFRKWADAQVNKFIIVERRFTDLELKYSGQVDFVMIGTDRQLYLADIKTCYKPHKTYPLQMAAYELLLSKQRIDVNGAMLVYLDKNGEFPDVHCLEDMTKEREIFVCALDCWHYFNKDNHREFKDGTIDTESDTTEESNCDISKYLSTYTGDNERAEVHCEGDRQSERAI